MLHKLRIIVSSRYLTYLAPLVLMAQMVSYHVGYAQQGVLHSKLAPAGDSPAIAGPLASNLSGDVTQRDVSKAIRLVADWQLERLPSEPQYDWTFAALYTGFMSLPPEISGDTYRKAMFHIGEQLAWMPGPRVLHADDIAIGQTYLDLYDIRKNPMIIQSLRTRADEMMAAPDSPQQPLWWWCDALFMGPPVFAGLSRVTGDSRYLVYMDKEWTITSALLYDPETHLFSRDASFLEKHEKNGSKIFWARGNGWVMAGLVRVLERMPAGLPIRGKYERQLREMAEATAKLQGSDGLWRPGLLDADAYKLPEVSGSAFITYAMAYGVNHGILDRKTYEPVVDKAWKGMLRHIYADGRLGDIQPIGVAPDTFTETSSYSYGVGAFLLAGSEIYRSAKK